MARHTLSQAERENKKKFDEKLKHYSLEALEEVHKISVSAMNMDTRLKASIWILERTYGKNYQVYKEEQEQQLSGEVTINLISTPSKQNQRETIIDDKTLDITDDDEEWIRYEDTDDWGEQDIYKPHHKNSL